MLPCYKTQYSDIVLFVSFQLYEHYTTEDDSPPVEYLHIPQLLGELCLSVCMSTK